MAVVALLGVALTCVFSIIPHVWAQQDFLHIDCGATVGYTDDWGVAWVTDDAYISTGEVSIARDAPKDWKELLNLRFFRDSRAKHCYTLPVIPKQTYMVRAEFYFANYDISPPPYPSFQIALDSSIVENVTILRPSSNYVRELTFAATRNVTSLCLVRDATKTTPFISSIGLRAVRSLPPRVMEFLASNQSVATATRLYFNETTGVISYFKDSTSSDIYDRYWYGANAQLESNGYPMSAASKITSTAPLEFISINRTRDVSTDYPPSNQVNSVPQHVLRGMVTTTGNLTIPMNTTDPFDAYIQYYYVELDETVNVTDRSFYIESPGSTIPFLQNVRNRTGSALRLAIVYHNRAVISTDSKIFMYPDPARTSLKGPILSALEVFRTGIPWVPPTNDRDWTAIEFIKADMRLTSWRGDPCLPYPHEWLTCNPLDMTKEATVIAILLSGYNLTSNISRAFNQLLGITSLKLDNNSLTGPIPDLSALKNLKTLHLQNNNLTGSLPGWLASLPLQVLFVDNNSFSGEFPPGFLTKKWNFTYTGNPSLYLGSPSPETKPNIGVIIGGVVGGIVLLGVIVFLIVYFCCCRRGGSGSPSIQRGGSGIASVGSHANGNPGGAREYSPGEVAAATNNYKKEIGRGGFGPVFYGKLPDGVEVAVKALDNTSNQGQSEFINEVDILSRVHHKNLVSLVGYCRAPEKQMLIYEYIHRGSLRDHLDGDSSKTGAELLDWKTRLNIGLQAALGLEYLHTGCSPSLIHRDVKSSNILITSKYDAKVADFGLSRLVGEEDTTKVMTFVKGTAGYLDPEYYHTQMLSAKSDVYGFGVVLLELISGRLPIDRSNPNETSPNICEWARASLMQSDISAILDPALRASRSNHDVAWKVAEIALRSVEPKSVHRPTMTEVVQELHAAVALEEKASSSVNIGPSPRHSRLPSGYSDYSSNSQYALDSASYPSAR